MVISFSVFSVSAEAISVYVTENNYGDMVPTNYNFTKEISTVYLYGNYDYINFKIDSNSINNFFFFEIYADADYTKPVYSDYTQCDMGYYNYTPYINMVGKFSSKTYYGITYAASVDYSGNIKISQPSVRTFKIVVNRFPKYNQQVVGLKSATNTVHGPQISWYKLSDSTTKYYIYRRYNYSSNKQWKLVGIVDGSTYSFIDKSTKNTSAAYIYTVRGQDKNGLYSRYHYNGVASSFVQAPVINYVATCANNTIQIKWNHVNSADSYYLYRRVNNGSWVLLGELTGNVYNDTSVVNGNNYKYTVRAKKSYTIDFERNLSAYYAGKGVDYIQSPEINVPEYTEDGITISWKIVQGAVRYAIYRKPLDEKTNWRLIGKVDAKNNSFIDTTALKDGGYLYTVRSEGENFQGSYIGKGVEYFNLAPPDFKVNVKDNKITLSWDPIPYADSYEVYGKFAGDDYGWHYLKNSKVCTYEITPKTYADIIFAVRSVRGNTKSVYKYSDNVVVYAFLPVEPNYIVYEDYIKLYWNGTEVDSYNIYRKLASAPDSEYELIANTTQTKYNDTMVQYDVAYEYSIRGVKNSVEQSTNLTSKIITKYSPEKYIKSFKVNQIVSYDERNNTTSYDYEFEVEKTPEGKDFKTTVYALGVNGWVNVNNPYYDFRALKFATAEPVFYAVAYDSNGRTPIDSSSALPLEEMCEIPEIKLNVLKNTVNVSWDAVDDAVEYSVEEKNSWTKKTVDGSINSINFNISDLRDEDLNFCISVKHSNGNVNQKTMNAVRYTTSVPAVVRVTSGANGNSVYLEGPMHYENSVYHIFRKAPGQKNWTRIGYYQGKPYVDSTAQAGVKYTYTVRLYDYVNKFYMSYYDTVGVQVGQIQTPRLIRARNYRDMTYGDGISITWDYTYDDVQCYYIYRKTANTGWKKIATTEKSWFWDITTQPGVTYYYTVRAYDGTILSGYDPVGVKCTKS